jgi:predicted protein tyrosine phosphatase
MITLAVCAIYDVPRFAQSNLTDIVSIGDPVVQPPPDFSPFPNTRIHRFEFSDVHHIMEISPTADDIKRIIELADGMISSKEDIRVLFHCQAGIARSTAAAFILCVRAGMTYQQAYDHILRVRGVLNPNMLMIKIADELMGHEGKMLGFIMTHRWDGEKGNADALAWAKENNYSFST